MRKEPKKAKRKIKDLETGVSKGDKVKGGQAKLPDRDGVYRVINRIAKPR